MIFEVVQSRSKATRLGTSVSSHSFSFVFTSLTCLYIFTHYILVLYSLKLLGWLISLYMQFQTMCKSGEKRGTV